jgi:hypothetical protein
MTKKKMRKKKKTRKGSGTLERDGAGGGEPDKWKQKPISSVHGWNGWMDVR